MKYIYVVLIKAHTGLGRVARVFSHYEYTHVAVSLDRTLTDFITFSRRKHFLPLDAGIMHEYRDYYAFGNHRQVKIKVFKVPVAEQNYTEIMRFISKCENDSEYIFNLFSMMTMPILHGFEIYKAYNCMSFTARIVELTGAVDLQKPYYKYSIKDMEQLLQKYEYFEGNIARKSSCDYTQYMKKYNVSNIFSTGADTIFNLTKRLLFSRNRNEN